VDADAHYVARVDQLRTETDRVVRRLHSLTRHSWESRRESVYSLLVDLADLCAAAEGTARRPVPRLADHSLPDAVSVIAGDLIEALAAAPSPARLAAAEAALRALRSEIN
jgi:hypothetical protein